MIKVGVTGGIGSGKTTVCKIFETLGIPIYYADVRGKELMQTDPELIKKITELFGKQAYTNGELNRKFISSQVFQSKPLLEKLNALVHPAVAMDAEKWADQYQSESYIIKEAALLFENGSYKQLDKIITVYASQELRIKRVRERDNVSYDEVVARIKNQIPDDEKVKKSDFVIYNDGKHTLIKQVLSIHYSLLNEATV